jgi:hypothetical protein
MSSGDDPVEQKGPPVATLVSEPAEKKSIWERLKPVWWLRGVLGALALVGFLDQIGWVREGWLPVVHAIATRWGEFIAWLSKTITIALPFGGEITPAEGHYLTVMFAVILPGIIPAMPILVRNPRTGASTMVVPAFVSIAGTTVLATLWPGETVLVGGSTPVFVPLLLIMSTFALCLAYLSNKAYFKALVVTITFFATLEVLYLAPFIQDALQPAVDWVSNGPDIPDH